jgi:hypothetical protein
VNEVTSDSARLFTLRRHHLIEPARPELAVDVIDDILGLNAQGALNYQLSLWSRVEGLDRGFVRRALTEEKTLVRSWLMRDTVHIVPSRSFPNMRAALMESLMGEWNRWTVKTGSKEALKSWEEHYPEVLEALAEGPLTANEILAELEWSREDGKRILHRVIREMSLQGLLCHASSSGQWHHDTEHTFSRVDKWLPGADIDETDRDEAKKRLVVGYLRGFGPASISDFSYWTGMRVRDGGYFFKLIEDSIEEIHITGQRASCYLLKEDLSDLLDSDDIPATARLLPQFDSLIMGHKDKERFIDPSSRSKIFLPRADVAATILLDGLVKGVWKMKREKKKWNLELRTFENIPEEDRSKIESEVDRLRKFTNFTVESKWEEGWTNSVNSC